MGWDRVGHSKQGYAAGDTTAGTLVGTNHKAVEVNEENPTLNAKRRPTNPINPKRIRCSFAQGRGSSRGRTRPQSTAPLRGEEKKKTPSFHYPDQRESPHDLLVGLKQLAHKGWDRTSRQPVALMSFPENRDPQRIRLLSNQDPNYPREPGNFCLDFLG